MKLKGLFAQSSGITKAILLAGIPLFLMIFSSALSLIFCTLQGIDMESASATHMLWMQAVQSVATFVLGGWLYAYLISPHPMQYLGLCGASGSKVKLYVLAWLGMVSLSPLISVTALWNDAITLPACLQSLETWMRSMEDVANETTLTLMQGDGIGHWIGCIVVMAAIPALGEELLFRGCLQKGLQNKTSNGHLAVWLTACIFSFIHFQFYGFIPRMILGVVLGYFYLYSQSLWVPIWAHFYNNATSVIAYKLFYEGGSETNLSTMGAPTDLETTWLIGLAVVSLAVYACIQSIFVIVARNGKTQ
jgi:membrane protease YdiL (CAAX protease family)